MITIKIRKKLNAGKLDLDLDLNIEKGKLITLYGESGAGKTSILKMISGLMQPDSGNITVDGSTWFDSSKRINFTPQKRSTGLVFQDYALFPNMSVRENLNYASGKSEHIDHLIDIMELGDLADRKPDTLSGGQKQRTALARALVNIPEILLLDEPLSALNMEIRHKLQDHILSVHKEFGLTTILVSHEVSEIFRLSDQVIKLENGQITDSGSPLDIFTDRHISGKFQFTGEIVDLVKEDVVWVLTILIGNSPVKVIVDEAEDLKIGDKVLVASKAFNPIVRKIH